MGLSGGGGTRLPATRAFDPEHRLYGGELRAEDFDTSRPRASGDGGAWDPSRDGSATAAWVAGAFATDAWIRAMSRRGQGAQDS